MTAWFRGDWARVLTVLALAAATTGYVWMKVQMAESARAIETARASGQALMVESWRLQASLDLASRPSLLRQRAERELGLTYPDPGATADLFVTVTR